MKETAQQSRPAFETARDPSLRVLLVEDNSSDAEYVRDILRRSRIPFSLVRCDRLSAALAYVAGNAVDVVLLDFCLPDSEGVSTFEQLQAVAPSLPVIVLTSTKDDRIAISAVRKGAQDYLVKWDLDQELLERTIRYAIERKAAEEKLRESEERYALAVEGAHDGLWDWNLRTATIHFSARCESMLGRPCLQVTRTAAEWFGSIHPEDSSLVQRAIDAHLGGDTPHLEVEYRCRHRDGADRWILARGLAVRNASGQAYRMAGSLTDITERKRAEQELVHSAFHDHLTGLANRSLFLDRLQQAMIQSRRRRRSSHAVLFADLDRFKNVNDSLGHGVGDKLLISLARRLEAVMRPGDSIARLGGDEFAILVGETRRVQDVCRVAARLLDSINVPFRIDDHEVFMTASIGIAIGGEHYKTPDEILRDADTAMYRAKARGKARYEVFDGAMHHSAVALLKLETDLRHALDRGEFVVYFQPIMDIKNGGLHSFEALIRWKHPDRGLLRPAEFLQLAEETGLIVPIGEWILMEACLQTREWQKLYPSLRVSVNVSHRQLREPDFVRSVGEILRESKVDPCAVILEVTESTVSDDPVRLGEKLMGLRQLGLKIFIDDFGSGYSSLSHLNRLPYDTLKIDRSFVSGIGREANSPDILQAIVALARHLGMGVVAEGVETEEQLLVLKNVGCELGQGFWFSAPLDGAGAEVLLAQDACRRTGGLVRVAPGSLD